MLASDLYKVPIGVSVGLIVLVLGVSMAASWWSRRNAREQDAREPFMTTERSSQRSRRPGGDRQ
jgi:hypothetical protein